MEVEKIKIKGVNKQKKEETSCVNVTSGKT